jgi:hypothetical protein
MVLRTAVTVGAHFTVEPITANTIAGVTDDHLLQVNADDTERFRGADGTMGTKAGTTGPTSLTSTVGTGDVAKSFGHLFLLLQVNSLVNLIVE